MNKQDAKKIMSFHKKQMNSITNSIRGEDEKQMAYDNMIDAEIDDAKEEKLTAEAREQTEYMDEREEENV